MGKFFHDLFEKYKFARRVALIWAIVLITYVVKQTLSPELFPFIQSPQATVIVAMIGILTTVVGFYQWSRNRDPFDPPD